MTWLIGVMNTLVLFLAQAAMAAEMWSNPGTITSLEAGWSQDTIAVEHVASMVNPDNCPVTNGGYATDPADPGHTLYHMVAEQAFNSMRAVQFLISGCVFGKPKIIAVRLVAPCPPSQEVKTVTNSIELVVALKKPDFTGTIFIPSGTPDIDLSTQFNIPIQSCVTLKGTRGGMDRGTLIKTTSKITQKEYELPLFVVNGHDVRIEGLRFEGPVPTFTEQDRKNTGGRVIAVGIWGYAHHVEIDNNDFYFWNHAINVSRGGMSPGHADLIRLTRNYFHRNANDGNGYGVVVGGEYGGYVTIEGNLFTHNRHAIAHTGAPRSGYIARFNYVLEGGFTEGGFEQKGITNPINYWNQHLDIHGQGSGGYGGVAGEYFDISSNTIRGNQTYGGGTQTRPAFMMRGKPTIKASFSDNVVMHSSADTAVRLKNAGCGPLPAQCNLSMGPNLYSTDTTGELAVGDFDGDGRDDVFLANGTGWWYSSAGKTEWRFLQASNLRVKDLRFGRFNNDHTTDILFSDGVNWWVSLGGTAPRQWVRTDGTRLPDCVFGDFNGDGITDALRTNGTTWMMATNLVQPWMQVGTVPFPVPTSNLRVGDFNADSSDDVLVVGSNKFWWWQYRTRTLSTLNANSGLSANIANLIVADFNGDRLADVAWKEGNGWQYSPGGSGPTARLRDSGGQWWYADIGSVLLGRFTNRESRIEAIRYELLPGQVSDSGQTAYDKVGKRFVIWKGYGTGHAFAPWTPDLQEMR